MDCRSILQDTHRVVQKLTVMRITECTVKKTHRYSVEFAPNRHSAIQGLIPPKKIFREAPLKSVTPYLKSSGSLKNKWLPHGLNHGLRCWQLNALATRPLIDIVILILYNPIHMILVFTSSNTLLLTFTWLVSYSINGLLMDCLLAHRGFRALHHILG